MCRGVSGKCWNPALVEAEVPVTVAASDVHCDLDTADAAGAAPAHAAARAGHAAALEVPRRSQIDPTEKPAGMWLGVEATTICITVY